MDEKEVKKQKLETEATEEQKIPTSEYTEEEIKLGEALIQAVIDNDLVLVKKEIHIDCFSQKS